MADTGSILRKRQREREQEREKRREQQDRDAQERERRQERGRFDEESPVRRMTRPADVDNEAQRSRQLQQRQEQQRQQDRQRATVVTGAGNTRQRYQAPEESEGRRWRPPQPTDNRDEESDADRESQRSGQLRQQLINFSRPAPYVAPRTLYNVDDNRQQVGLGNERIGRGPTDLFGTGPESDTRTAQWRPQWLGPRTQEEADQENDRQRPIIGPAFMARKPMEFGVQLGNRLGGAVGDWANAQMTRLGTGTPVTAFNPYPVKPPERLGYHRTGQDDLMVPDVNTGTPSLSSGGTAGLNTLSSAVPNTAADTLSNEGIDPTNPLTNLNKETRTSPFFSGRYGSRWELAQLGVGQAYRDASNWRHTAGSNTGLDKALDYGGDILDKTLAEPTDRLAALPVPGTNYSIGQVGQAFGTALKKYGEASNAGDWKQLPTFGNSPTAPFEKGKQFVNTYLDELRKSGQAWNYIAQLPSTVRPQAAAAFISLASGGEAVQRTAEQIVNKDKTIADLQKKADEAKAQWQQGIDSLPGVFYKDPARIAQALTAAEYGRQIRELKSKTNWDIVQENQNPYAEFVEGVILDPTNVIGPIASVFGLTPEAFRAAKAAKKLDELNAMNPEQASKYVQDAYEAAKPLAQSIAGGTPLSNVDGWWQTVNPLARRTPDTLAHQTADNLFRQATSMLSGVTDKQTAQEVLNLWVNDPAQLARGIQYNGEPLRFGAAVLENTPQNRAVLSQLSDQIGKLSTLTGDGPLNMQAVAGELDNLVYSASRRGYGLDKLKELPVGTVRTVLKKQGENGIIQYLDNKGRVLGTSAEKSFYEAQLDQNKFIEAARSGGLNPIVGAAKGASDIQRAILSDMWLNMRPGHWIRNALAATATLAADDLYTLRPTTAIREDLERKGIGIVDAALGETSGGRGVTNMTGVGPEHWSERGKFGWKNNPLAQLSKGGSKIWAGNTDIAGRIPFGEENFRLRAYAQAFNRFFDPNWTRTATEQYGKALVDAGVTPEFADQLSNWVVQAGIRGNKMDVVDTARRLANANAMPINLQSLGVEPQTFSNQAWGEIFNTLNDGNLTHDQAWNQIQAIAEREKRPFLDILGQAPAQEGRTVNTVQEELADGADLIDQAVFLAKQSGQDPAMAESEARKYVEQLTKNTRDQWETFLRESAADPNPQAFDVIVDAWGQVQKLRNQARNQVDNLTREAMDSTRPFRNASWDVKWQDSRSIYDQLPTNMQKVFDQARTDLATGNTSRTYSYWDLIDEYLGYDEAAIKEARDAGMQLGKANKDVDWEKTIAANRQYVDKSFAELLGTLQQFPSQDALDIAISAQKQVEAIGASAAGKLRPLREAALDSNTTEAWNKYFKVRNKTWYEAFDNMALTNNVARYDVALSALAKDTESGLVWTDEFAGGQFQLMRPVGNGQWLAKKLEDGSMHTFASVQPNGTAVSTAPQVPPNVLNDWYKIAGEHDKIVEDTLASIPPIHGPQTESEAGIRGVWRTEEGDQPVKIIKNSGQNVEGTTTYQVRTANGETYDADMADLYAVSQGQLRNLTDVQTMMDARNTIDMADPQAIQQARLDMRREWDAKVKANWGGMSLDTYVAKYYRDGTVIIPDKAKRIQDIYGTTVAGRTINNQDDLERFVLEYANLKQQADELKGAAGRAQEQYISAANRTEPYVIRSGDNVGEDARQVFSQGNPTTTPTVSTVADFRLQEIEAAKRAIQDNLAAVLKGTPNNLTPAQRLRAIDAAANLGATFDNVLSGAMKQAQDMADFAMLNFRDRRNMDVALSQIFPYHYFWTRSAKNWAQRIATKPAVANLYYEQQKLVDAENRNNNVPEYRQGTIPNPLNQVGIGPERVANPMDYAFPWNMYAGNDFINPEEAKTQGDYYLRLAQKYTPGIMPAYDLALKYMRDDLTDTSTGDYIPFQRMGGYGWQAATGGMGKPGSIFNYGDQWDVGRAAKQVALNVISGDANPALSKWALDVGYQIKNNVPALPEQPEAARAVWEAAAKEAGYNRFWATVGGYVLGLPFYDMSPEDQKMRAMKEQRYELGYSADNPYGSKEAQRGMDAQTGGILDPAYEYSSLYPGNEDAVRPGRAELYDEKMAERDAIYAERQKARDEYLTAHPDATEKELKEATNDSSYFDRIDALDEKYKNAATGGGFGGPPRGMNETETAYWHLEQILQNSKQGKPERPENFESLSDAEKQKYYTAIAAWAPTQLDAIERGVNGLLAADETEIPGIQNWRGELEKMAKGQYASELLRRYGLRYASDTERRWDDVESLRQEMTSAEIAAGKARVKEHFSDEAYAAWEQYSAIDKDAPGGKEARAAFGKEHPYVYLMNKLAYHPEGYQSTTAKFGEGWEDTYLNYPDSPGKDATEEQKQAFYAAEDKYIKANPTANEVMLWVDGRWKPSGVPDEYKNNGTFGVDYEEAVRLFGPDIFELDRNVPTGGGKPFGQYMDAHPTLWSYWEWQKELTQMTPEQYMAAFPVSPDEEQQPLQPGEYSGPRPYGSNRTPIGLTGGPLNIAPQAAYPSNMGLSTEPLPGDQERASIVTGVGGAEVPLGRDRVTLSPAGSIEAATTGASTTTGGLSATGRTAEDYLKTSEPYQKYAAKRAEWKKNEALWAGRRETVVSGFGEEAGKTWDEYYKLPKGDARKQYRADHPELKIYTIAAFNPEDYKAMGELFTPDDMLDWAYAPPWDGTEETDQARKQYWAEHPTAFNVGAFVNGRPKPNTGEQDDHDPLSEDWEYNFGADYTEAQKLFGDDIWSIVSQQKQLPDDKRARAQWYDAHPEYSQWADWWYANMPDTGKQTSTYARSGPGYDSLGHRAYGSYGGGGGGGGYGGGGGAYVPRVQLPEIQPRYMNSSLWNAPESGMREWRPFNIDMRPDQENRGKGLKRTWA